jgi:hypothetical protein
MVQWAVEARLGLKSTIKQSRAERFLNIAQRMGVMPVALTYYGAGTGRYAASSSAKVNMQNLPAIRGSKDPDAGLLRKALRAPPGKVVVVSDASQIEARLVMWQAGQERMLEVFRTGGDPYSVMASQIFGRHVDRKKNPDDYVPGFIGKAVVLGAGYGLGHLKFGSMIFTGMLGGPSVLFDDVMVDTLGVDVDRYSRYIADKPDMLARLVELKPAGVETEPWVKHMACAFKIINTFRENNPEIPAYWKTGERMLRAMLLGSDEKIGHFQMASNKLMLPNRMWLQFKELEFDKKEGYSCLRKKEGRVKRVKVYGGSVVENCVAFGTLVLTSEGWMPIEQVSRAHLVCDGVDFVTHGGVVFNQFQTCTVVDGVFMTPDHEVLTNEGWKPALEKPRPYRPNLRTINRTTPGTQRREEDEVGIHVQMRGADNEGRNGGDESTHPRGYPELWVQDARAPKTGKQNPRDEQAPSFCSMEKYAGQVPITHPPSVEELRREGDNCVPEVAVGVREILGRHGTDVCVRHDARQDRQRKRIFETELPVDIPQGASEQQARQPDYPDAEGVANCRTGIRGVQNWAHDATVPDGERMPTGATAREAGLQKPVYDIINCGPRSRFVVLGDGGPFIVHNCSQSLAGAYVKEAMVRMYLKGHRTILQVHDEVVCLADADKADQVLREVNECMETVPAWAEGLPLAAEGDWALSYGEAK